MSLTPKLEIKQSQSLLMTPQLRQAINLLQMSNLQLGELVEQELQNNPLLEKEDDSLATTEVTDHGLNDYEEDHPLPEEEAFSSDVAIDNCFDDSGSDREGYENENDFSWEDYNHRKNNSSDEDFDYFEKKLGNPKSLYTFLDEQIQINFAQPQQRLIARSLSEHLDEAGYFRGSVSEISKKLNASENDVLSILKSLKTFEPSGIFAETLAECLQIQLIDKDRCDPLMQCLLQHLDLLAARNFKELKKVCAVDDEDLSSMIADIKSLNPKPIAAFDYDLTTYIIPDVFVRNNKYGEYRVELNSLSLPKVLINRQYYSEISRNSGHDKIARRYLKEQLSNASFLIKAMHQRATTVLRVSEEIVKAQREFFEKGIEYLKPMLLRDIAENIEMHESTVSRVTANKYMQTPRGLFELKYFFSAAAGSFSGDENTSTTSIKYRLKKFIDEESSDNILSDDKLVENFAALGIKIARRTIAKYRDSLNIPSSSERKKQKRSEL